MREQEKIIAMTEQEEQIYDSIVQEYGQMIFRLAFSERNNWHDGEEIAQETFLVLAKNIHKAKNYERIDLWLLRVLNHQILHYYRNTHQDESWEDIEDTALPTTKEMLPGEDAQELLNEFPEVDKMIFQYLRMGYNLRETAEMMGIGYIYCRVRKNRAQKKLEAEARKRKLLK